MKTTCNYMTQLHLKSAATFKHHDLWVLLLLFLVPLSNGYQKSTGCNPSTLQLGHTPSFPQFLTHDKAERDSPFRASGVHRAVLSVISPQLHTSRSYKTTDIGLLHPVVCPFTPQLFPNKRAVIQVRTTNCAIISHNSTLWPTKFNYQGEKSQSTGSNW